MCSEIAEFNKRNLQIWKTSDVNILNFMRKHVTILFGTIMLMNTSRGYLQMKIQQSNIFKLVPDLGLSLLNIQPWLLCFHMNCFVWVRLFLKRFASFSSVFIMYLQVGNIMLFMKQNTVPIY